MADCRVHSAVVLLIICFTTTPTAARISFASQRLITSDLPDRFGKLLNTINGASLVSQQERQELPPPTTVPQPTPQPTPHVSPSHAPNTSAPSPSKPVPSPSAPPASHPSGAPSKLSSPPSPTEQPASPAPTTATPSPPAPQSLPPANPPAPIAPPTPTNNSTCQTGPRTANVNITVAAGSLCSGQIAVLQLIPYLNTSTFVAVVTNATVLSGTWSTCFGFIRFINAGNYEFSSEWSPMENPTHLKSLSRYTVSLANSTHFGSYDLNTTESIVAAFAVNQSDYITDIVPHSGQVYSCGVVSGRLALGVVNATNQSQAHYITTHTSAIGCSIAFVRSWIAVTTWDVINGTIAGHSYCVPTIQLAVYNSSLAQIVAPMNFSAVLTQAAQLTPEFYQAASRNLLLRLAEIFVDGSNVYLLAVGQLHKLDIDTLKIYSTLHLKAWNTTVSTGLWGFGGASILVPGEAKDQLWISGGVVRSTAHAPLQYIWVVEGNTLKGESSLNSTWWNEHGSDNPLERVAGSLFDMGEHLLLSAVGITYDNSILPMNFTLPVAESEWGNCTSCGNGMSNSYCNHTVVCASGNLTGDPTTPCACKNGAFGEQCLPCVPLGCIHGVCRDGTTGDGLCFTGECQSYPQYDANFYGPKCNYYCACPDGSTCQSSGTDGVGTCSDIPLDTASGSYQYPLSAALVASLLFLVVVGYCITKDGGDAIPDAI